MCQHLAALLCVCWGMGSGTLSGAPHDAKAMVQRPVQTFPDRAARRFTYHSSVYGMHEYAEIVRQYADRTTARNNADPRLGAPSLPYPSSDICRRALASLSDAFLKVLTKLEYISILALRARGGGITPSPYLSAPSLVMACSARANCQKALS